MIDGFLSLYSVVPLSEGVGVKVYRLLKTYAKSHGLHVFDSLIAATAMENGTTADDIQGQLNRFRNVPGRQPNKYKGVILEVRDESGRVLYSGGVY